jgi:hypothetical protein
MTRISKILNFRRAIEAFFNTSNYNNWILAVSTGAESLNLYTELPEIKVFKKKSALIFKARTSQEEPITNENVAEEVCSMEFSKNVLENLSLLC